MAEYKAIEDLKNSIEAKLKEYISTIEV